MSGFLAAGTRLAAMGGGVTSEDPGALPPQGLFLYLLRDLMWAPYSTLPQLATGLHIYGIFHPKTSKSSVTWRQAQ